MALPAIVAGAGRGLAKGARGAKRRIGEAARKRPPAERPPVEAPEVPREEVPGEETTRKLSVLLSTEGVLMMSVGGILDIFSIIGAILILAFGIGLVFAKIVYIVGFIIIGSWVLFRSGTLPGEGKMRKKMVRGFTSFLKRQWPKLAGKAVPAVGDVLPLWTWIVYSELTSG
jgi:hypothetical protein